MRFWRKENQFLKGNRQGESGQVESGDKTGGVKTFGVRSQDEVRHEIVLI